MVKKLKTLAKTNTDSQLADAVRASAQQIWQAGLGAFAKAQEEGGRVFAKLVKEGTDLQKRTQKLAEDKVSEVTGTVSQMANGVQSKAVDSLDKLEKVFEDRVARALTTIGVPTQKDIQTLSKRVDTLAKAVSELTGKKAPAAKAAPAKKAVAKKPAAKKPAVKAVAKKAVAKKPAAKKPVAKKAAPAAASAA